MNWKEKVMIGKAWHYSKSRKMTACGLTNHEFLYTTRILKKVNCYKCLKTKIYKSQLAGATPAGGISQ